MAPIFEFDDVNQLIIVPMLGTLGETVTEITCQQIVDAVRNWQDELIDMQIANFLDASGKEALGGGVFVGITIKLTDWKIQFAARPGPAWVMCNVTGGNLVAFDTFLNDYVWPLEPSPFTNGYIARSSSATLLQQEALEYGTFDGGVWIDVVAGSPGTAYPAGTPEYPVDNLADAQTIAVSKGFFKLYIIGDITFGATDNIDTYNIVGETMNDTTVTLTAGVSTINTKFEECYLVGAIGGQVEVRHCRVDGISNVGSNVAGSTFFNCILEGLIVLKPTNNQLATFIECWSSVPGSPPALDLNGCIGKFSIREYSGEILVRNVTAGQNCAFDFVSGHLTFENTVTDLIATVTGMVRVVNNAVLVPGASIDLSGIMLPETAFGGFVWVDTDHGESGTVFPIGTTTRPVDNIIDAYTIATNFNLRGYKLCGPLVLDRAYTSWNFSGMSAVAHDTIDLAGQDISGSQFNKVSTTGSMGVVTSMPQFLDCGITDMTGANCLFYYCGLFGTIKLAAGPGTVLNCVGTAVSMPTIIDMNGAGQTFIGQLDGNVQFINAGAGLGADPTFMRITVNDGLLQFAASCIAGSSAVISGSARLENLAPAMIVIDNTQFGNDSVWDEQLVGHATAGSTGKALADAGAGANPWDVATAGHALPGTFGEITQQLVGSVVAGVTTAAALSTNVQIRTPLLQADNFFNGMFIVVQNAAGNVVRRIADYTALNGAFYVDDALPFVPAPGDVVYITAPNESETTVANAVWDAPTAGHVAPGTTGEALSDIQADAVTLLAQLAEVIDMQENKFTINQATSELWLWDDAGAVVIKKWPIRDRLNAAVVLGGTGPADRLTRTL